MSAFTAPILIQLNGATHSLQRIALGNGTGQYDEQWLQDLLFRHPETLPIREIDPHASALVPVCTELSTGAGPADILYVTCTGQIVLVETKLWRNAEARRTVVAQILDYAKELADWTYEDLSRAAASASGCGSGHLLDTVRGIYPDLDEAAFVDGINRSLETGDFILIIAGDGIRSRAEALVGFIDRFAQLRFRLALIEVATFLCPDGSVLMQPRILAKTELLIRHVVMGGDRVSIRVDANAESSVQPQDPAQKARALADALWLEQFWRDFLNVLRLDDIKQPFPKIARTTSATLYLPPGGNMAWISAYIARASGRAGVFMTFARSFSSAANWFQQLMSERMVIDEELAGLSWRIETHGKIWIELPAVQYRDLDNLEDRARVIDYLAQNTNAMINTFRHRLETLHRAEDITGTAGYPAISS